MKITLETVHPSQMRYATTGDWEWLPDGSLKVTVAAWQGNERSAFLVAIHEAVEAVLCWADGIDENVVSDWDKNHPDAEEPAEVEGSPYMDQHSIATQVELKIAAGLRMNWDKHNDWVQEAGDQVEKCLNTRQSN